MDGVQGQKQGHHALASRFHLTVAHHGVGHAGGVIGAGLAHGAGRGGFGKGGLAVHHTQQRMTIGGMTVNPSHRWQIDGSQEFVVSYRWR